MSAMTTPYGKVGTNLATMPDGAQAHAEHVHPGFGVDTQYTGDSLGAPHPVSAAHRSDVVQVGSVQCPVKFKSLALTGSGDVVAAVANKKIRVLSMFGFVTTSGTVKFQSNAVTDLTGAARILDGGSMILTFNPGGWFETLVGEKLNAVLASITGFNGGFNYIEV